MDIARYPHPAADRRLGLALTALVHMVLLFGWQAARTLPAPRDGGLEQRILWIPLPQSRPVATPARRPEAKAEPVPETAPAPASPVPHAQAPVRAPALPANPPKRPGPAASKAPEAPAPALPASPSGAAAAAPAAVSDAVPAKSAMSADTPADAPADAKPAKPGAEQILQQARRDIGRIDKDLRKENKPYIVAPLDSPQIRLRKGIEHAAELAPPRPWEAPKTQELVNNTGDGARRTRVITGRRTYCVTERATNTDVEMIEHHGKIRITNCPTPEEPAKAQDWRTARD